MMDTGIDAKTIHLPIINTQQPRQNTKSILSILQQLCINVKPDSLVINFLIFVAGVERNPEITEVIKSQTNNYKSYKNQSNINDDPYEMITTDLEIVDLALKHALQIKSLVLIKYILDNADKCYINATMNDRQILALIEDLGDETTQSILKYISTKDITLANQKENDANSHDKSMNASPMKRVSTLRKRQTIIQIKEQVKIKNSGRSKGPSDAEAQLNTKKPALKKNPFTKFLNKNDIVEIAIRAPNISDEEELHVITVLFDQLSIPTNETVSLFKLLIYYEQINTFEMLLSHMVKTVKIPVDRNKVMSDTDKQVILGRNDDDNLYDYDEIISDAFSYAISLNKIHIALYLFKTYEDDVYGNKLLCIKSILNSFKNDETQVNQVLYLEERLFILEKFINYAEYKMALEFLDVMHEEIRDNAKTNFLVYTSNPLKIIVLLLNIVIHLSNKHQNLRFKAQKVRSSLCDIANGIIDSSSNMKEVEDMLLDKMLK